jgi:hypothetical protein
VKRELSPSFIRTGQRIERGLERLSELYRQARALCPHLFVAEETRTFDALYDHVPLGFVDGLRKEIAHKERRDHRRHDFRDEDHRIAGEASRIELPEGVDGGALRDRGVE